MFSFFRTRLTPRHPAVPVDVSLAPGAWASITCQSDRIQETVPLIHDVNLSDTVQSKPVPIQNLEGVSSTPIQHSPIKAPTWKTCEATPWRVKSHPSDQTVPCHGHAVPISPIVTLQQDLNLVARLPVTRRLHRIQDMSGTHWLYWLTRLARSRRLPTGRVHLIGIVPDVPLNAEQPVSWQADRQVIVFASNPDVHIPSTVVIGVDRDTDQWLIGRFYRENSGDT